MAVTAKPVVCGCTTGAEEFCHAQAGGSSHLKGGSEKRAVIKMASTTLGKEPAASRSLNRSARAPSYRVNVCGVYFLLSVVERIDGSEVAA